MNKIGIMTFHKSINYGSVLQAYALQQAVNKLGFSSEVIDYEPDNYKYLYGYFRIPKNSTNIKHDIINLRNLPLLMRRRKKFAEFRNTSLKMSSKQYKFGNKMDDLDNDYNFVICGSDQIWNPKAKDSDVNYFLPNSLNIKKISYAVSLNDGGASEFDDAQQYKKYLMDFDALSVREQSGKTELEKFLENKKTVEVVLDPSLLHKKETYYPICSERIIKQPYIFFYSVNHNKSTIEAVNILSKRLNLPVYYLYTNTSTRRTYKTYPEFEYMKHDVAPQDFISLIRYADFVITDSFHGTAFSIAFEKKFYSIGKTDSEGKKIRDERICNILASLGIEDRFITQTDAESVDFADIDYKDVNAKREALIELSLGYLKDALLSQFSLDNRYITPKSPTFDWQICKSDDCTGCFSNERDINEHLKKSFKKI